MSSLQKFTIITIALLLLGAGYYVFQSRASTTIDLTLKTNPNLERGLVGHWTFDGPDVDWGSSTAEIKDRSGQGNHGNAEDTMTAKKSPTIGVLGQGISIDNATSYVNAGSDSSLNGASGFSYSVWVTRTGTSPYQWPFVLTHGHSHTYYAIRSTNYGTTPLFEYGEPPFDGSSYSSISLGGDDNLPANEWHHYVVTYDGSTLTGYRDTVQTQQKTSITINSSFDQFHIGADNSNHAFLGTYDDVRIYNRVLSPNEIKRLYGLGATTHIAETITTNPTLETGLVGHWTFDGPDVTSATATDITGGPIEEWGSGGVVRSDPTSSNDELYALTIDGTYLYAAGRNDGNATDCPVGDRCWRIEKFNMSDGALVWATTSDPDNGDDRPRAITNDGTYLYVAGYEDINVTDCPTGGICWRMEKRNLSDGALVWATTSDPDDGNDVVNAVTNDGTYLYVAGYEDINVTDCPTGGICWRMEKRAMSDGALVWATTSDPDDGDDYAGDITNDGTYIYISGEEAAGTNCTNGGTCWRMEKRAMSDGALVWATTSDPDNGDDYAQDITNDGTYLYATGYEAAGTNCIGGDGCWRIEKRNLSDGALVWATTSDPDTTNYTSHSITNDGTHLYVVGDEYCFSVCWRMEKRAMSDGALVWATTSDPGGTDRPNDVIHDSTFLYIGGKEDVGGCPVGNMCWRIEKRRLSDGALVDGTQTTKHDGTITGATPAAGVIGQGMSFDGVGDYIVIPDSPGVSGGQDMTWAAWVNLDDAPVIVNTIFGKLHNSAYKDYNVRINNDLKLGFYYENGSDNDNPCNNYGCSSDGTITVGEWQFITVTYDYSEDLISYYINGTASGNTTLVYKTPDRVDDAMIGRGGYLTSLDWDGKLDDARIYNRALSPDEIKRLYGLGATTHIAETITTNPTLETGLVGHWTFDGMDVDWGSSTAEIKDRSGQGNHGNAQGGMSTRSIYAGVLGQALQFDGVDDYIDLGTTNTLGLTNVTFSAWLNWRGDSNYEHIFDRFHNVPSAHQGYEFYFDTTATGGTWVSLGDGTNIVGPGSTGGVTVGEWTHFVYTYDGTTGRWYFDGVAGGTHSDSAALASDASFTTLLGKENTGDNYGGLMDDVRIYDRALSADEVQRLYDLGQ